MYIMCYLEYSVAEEIQKIESVDLIKYGRQRAHYD